MNPENAVIINDPPVGREVKTKTTFNLVLDTDIAAKLRRVADWNGITQSAYIRMVLHKALRNADEQIEAWDRQRQERIQTEFTKLRRVK